jgi:hypothetical protein
MTGVPPIVVLPWKNGSLSGVVLAVSVMKPSMLANFALVMLATFTIQ